MATAAPAGAGPRRYSGTLKAAIFDWAGTTVDFGSRAPMGVFVRAFREVGINISVEQARIPMGLPKWDHIKAVGMLPDVAAQWRQVHARPFEDGDVARIYEIFVPLNVAVVTDFADLIPGTLEVVNALRARGLRIGSTTGYNRPIMEALLPVAAARGYAPEITVCAGDLAQGRPSPLMIWHILVQFGLWPAAAAVKIDDTVPGIEEGRNAGTWTVGVALTGNEVGLSETELALVTGPDLITLRQRAATRLLAAGAHYVIDGIADLPPVIEDIEQRLRRGEQP
ncbi:MAG: phosphonoacetaldehyde hydrolase [Azospirillaceae bacterium]|nr:phosphonoacetaldehyde hydrolase [Azospirillaceae bacterium]